VTVPPERFAALFDPRGVVVAGASSHPGKFGFVALHNILRHDYGGAVFATNRDGGEVLGVPTLRSIEELPEAAADLVLVCTPASANRELMRACAAKGVRAAFVTSAGYGEAGDEGRRAEAELVALADELGMRPLMAHCHLGLGTLAPGTEREQARKHFTTAASMYREMGMRFYLEQAEAAITEVA
jgi:acetyltransferase